ncbi:MAG: hypothetical protein ACK4NA_04550 [Alphaproteobacteria bacterium]
MFGLIGTARQRAAVLAAGTLAAFACGHSQRLEAQGLGDFTVTPTRLVFEGRDSTEMVTVVNSSAQTATFRISFVHMQMSETGELTQIETLPEGYKAAEPMLRYAPRQIEIPPGQTQVVRIALRKPEGLAAGEYRSHMFFRAVPDESRGQAIEQAGAGGSEGLRIELIPIFGITIPAIVRHGEISAKAALSEFALARNNDQQVLRFRIAREGDSSLYGDVSVNYTPPGGQGRGIVIAELNRVAVYPEVSRRLVEVALRPPSGVSLASGGTLEITYRSADPSAAVLSAGTYRIP